MRPIDADALKKTLLSLESYEVLVKRVLHEVVPELIDKAPTIETEPVRHGWWIDKGEYACCSECGGRSGTQYDGVEPVYLPSRFCPNCGADMLKEKAEPDFMRICRESVEPNARMTKIEAEPVRHGRWVYDHNGIVICTECRYPQQIGAKEFCGKCGARMDGVKGLHKQS